jgi:hypothetical protein
MENTGLEKSTRNSYISGYSRFEVLTTVTMKITVFWDVTSYSLVDLSTFLRNT